MIHELKIWNEYFEEVFTGYKTFEVRKNNFEKNKINNNDNNKHTI